MRTGKILVVDDEPDIRNLIKEILEDENFEVTVAENAQQAQHIYTDFKPHLIMLDIWMPDMDGITLLKQWNDNGQLNIPVIMISGHGTIETAVEATRLGAYDFIEKPLSLAKLTLTVRHALEHASLKHENTRLKKYKHLDTPIGKSQVIQKLHRQITQIVEHNIPVLLTGESGTGKELFARYLHNRSPRSAGPFISIAISALPKNTLLEDFFGSDEAGQARPGFLEQAESGTLLLKGITNMPPLLQARLQNTLENKYFIRIGDDQKKPLNARIIATTNNDILTQVNKGYFSDILYYQLNVLPIDIPPLREHPEDIPELLEFYVNFFAEGEGLTYRHFTVATQNYLRSYSWPGNIRELKNLVQRLLILGSGEEIHLEELNLTQEKNLATAEGHSLIPEFNMPLREARENFEKKYLQHRLNLFGGNVSKVAEAIGMERTHLYRKLKSLHIKIGNQDTK